jgi:signal transduction histidine kinase
MPSGEMNATRAAALTGSAAGTGSAWSAQPDGAGPQAPEEPAESRQRAQVRMLHSLAAKLNQCTSVEQIGEAVTAELRSLVDYHNCRVYVLQPDGLTLSPVAFRGELTEYQGETFEALVTTVGRGLTGHVALSGQSYYAPNANDDPHALTIAGTPDLDESILGAPMIFGERLIGVVILSKLGIDRFDGEDMRVLETVASHGAVAIENARSRAEIERALEVEREATKRLQVLDEVKNTFLQAVSHDLRTPLTTVMGLALTLDREDIELSAEERKELSNRLAANAKRLDRLLRNLLDLERLMQGVVEPRREPTDLAALVRQVIVDDGLEEGGRIDVDVAPLVADIDAGKVERIVDNLLANAVKHTPAGTPIWLRIEACPGGVLLVVEDAGPGIPRELAAGIFEPFYQGPGDHPSPGSGIGLSLVAKFAELHGGRTWVEDRPGGGASFRVELPCSVIPMDSISDRNTHPA